MHACAHHAGIAACFCFTMPQMCGQIMTPTRKRRSEQNRTRSWIGDRGHATFRHVLGMVDCPDSGTHKPLHNPPSEYQSMNQCTIGPCTVPNRHKKQFIRTQRDQDMYKSMSLSSPGPTTVLNSKEEFMIDVRRKMQNKSTAFRTHRSSAKTARSELVQTKRSARQQTHRSGH